MDNLSHSLSNDDLEHSTKLDKDLWSDAPEAKNLVKVIWDDGFQAFNNSKNTRGKRPATPLIDQLRILILNLFKNWFEDPSLLLGVSMTKGGYKVKSRYNSLKISSKLIELVVGLQLLTHRFD